MDKDDVTSERSTASAMSGILISRIFGFLRGMVIASFFGLGPPQNNARLARTIAVARASPSQ